MGDVEKGFQEADVITEGTFGYENIPNPLPPEPPGAIALWEEPNKVTLWVSTQTSYMDKFILFHVIGRKVEVRTIGGPCGGSFGSSYVLAGPVLCGASEQGNGSPSSSSSPRKSISPPLPCGPDRACEPRWA